MKVKIIEPFESISFEESCRLLESDKYFFMIFRGTDDLNDTYQSILLDNPEIGKGFVFPNGFHALLIEKTVNSKNLLVDYILELGHQDINYETIENWDDLIMVAFDGNYHIIESTSSKENRKHTVNKIKEEYERIFKSLKCLNLIAEGRRSYF